ncbi:MAG: hypothetical protein NTY87_10770, partial [Planctomycetia bacterium]|nr:hypothetical protein [Planctomycetia bacterium]
MAIHADHVFHAGGARGVGGSDGANDYAKTGTQTILYYTFTLPKKEGLMTFLQENNGQLEDDPGGHPTVVVPQFDPLD